MQSVYSSRIVCFLTAFLSELMCVLNFLSPSPSPSLLSLSLPISLFLPSPSPTHFSIYLLWSKRLNASQHDVYTFLTISYLFFDQASSSGMAAKSSMFSSIFRRQSIVHAPTVEGEYADTRHVGQLKVLLEQLLSGDLPTDRYPSFGIAAAIVKDGKSTVKSVRKYGANSRWESRNGNS